MERKITADLLKWKKESSNKPLLLYGGKQIGKTYSALDFGKKYYKTVVYIDCLNNSELLAIAKKEKSPEKIILKLSLLAGETILKEDTLIILDNMCSVEISKMVKLFGNENNQYHIIMITSIKDNVSKFKCEEFQYKNMTGVDFEEFLKALGQEKLIEFIKDSYKTNKPMPFHQLAIDYFDKYVMAGSSPEAIEMVLSDQEYYLPTVHGKILDTYKKEFVDNLNAIDINRAVDVINAIPGQLLKSNRKFQYGHIKPGSRSKDFETAISFISNNQFAHRCYKVSEIGAMLSKYKELDSFKLYSVDTGVLFHSLHLTKLKMLSDDELKYLLYENSIANVLSTCGFGLYYYASDGKAEVAFVIQTRNGQIIPIELVNTKLTKAKSLGLFMSKFNVNEAIRIGEDNFSYKKGIKYVPVYATFCLKENL